jgi:hypothetical protein
MNFRLNEQAYNFLKWFTLIALPAISSLYFGLSDVWDLPNATQVVGTIALLTTFLGTVLGISTKSYNNSDAAFDGDVQVSAADGGKTIMQLAFNDPPERLVDRSKLTFKVVHTDEIPEGFAE